MIRLIIMAIIIFAVVMLLITTVMGIRAYYKEYVKYNYKSLAFTGWKQMPDGKYLYKFMNKDEKAVAMYGTKEILNKVTLHGIYNLEVENDKYVVGVKRIA